MARPGIMIYFDLLRPIRKLSYEDGGKLLIAMLEYGKDGIIPEFDGALDMAWEFVKPKIDKDGEMYEISCVQREYAAFCKLRKKLGLPKISFEEWKEMDEHERQRMTTDDNEPLRAVNSVEFRYPTTTTSTTTNTTTPTTTAAATNTTANGRAAAATGESVPVDGVQPMGGALGKGVVFLSDEQMADLLEKMGVDTFNHYTDKLSEFILRNGAKVKNHYETILKWWTEDSQVRGG